MSMTGVTGSLLVNLKVAVRVPNAVGINEMGRVHGTGRLGERVGAHVSLAGTVPTNCQSAGLAPITVAEAITLDPPEFWTPSSISARADRDVGGFNGKPNGFVPKSIRVGGMHGVPLVPVMQITGGAGTGDNPCPLTARVSAGALTNVALIAAERAPKAAGRKVS
jgi:hypothetical protein